MGKTFKEYSGNKKPRMAAAKINTKEWRIKKENILSVAEEES